MIQLAIAFALAAPGATTLAQDEILFEGVGPHTRPIVTNSDTARRFFNQGLNFLFAFNHKEARRSFRAAARHDPECAMAWWGIATANGPHINFGHVDPSEEKEAYDALRKALAVMADEPAADQALIRAAVKRFADPQPKDRSPLDRTYAQAMADVYRRFPDDGDIGSLYAESLMDLQPWDLWTHDGKPKGNTLLIVRTLEEVMERHPRHPFALHLYVHAIEASNNPAKAVPAADRLRDLTPALGHNQHMPSHIDIRVGDWEKAIVANQKAIKADKTYREKRPEQFIYRVYMAHNHHMLSLAAMMTGQRNLALHHIDTMCAEMPPGFLSVAAPVVDGFFAMPYEVRVRFGMWDEVLAMPEPGEQFPLTRALRRAARAVSYAAKGMTREARAEQSLFYVARAAVPAEATFGNNTAAAILKVGHHLMNGEILVAEGKEDAALRELRLAVAAEDALRYYEPPDWILPSRHVLGAALMKMGRYQEATAVYGEDLKRNPNNGWSLYGMSDALQRLGRHDEAARYQALFKDIWAHADIQIDSSCLCIPGKRR